MGKRISEAILRAAMREAGRRGGVKSAAAGQNISRLSADELREHQRAAAKARWDAMTPAQRKAAMRKVRRGKRKA